MREIVNMLLGFLARLQIAHRNDMVRPPGENDRPQQQLDGRDRTVGMAQVGFDRLVRPGEQLGSRVLSGKHFSRLAPTRVEAGTPAS